MLKSICLKDYVVITKNLCALAQPNFKIRPQFDGMVIFWIICKLQRAQLPLSNAHAKDLKEYGHRIRKKSISELKESDKYELNNIAKSLLEILLDETEKKKVLILASSSLSNRLKKLSKIVPITKIQRHLILETISSLECGSYRAAVVMGWSLAYDYLRHWTWRNSKRRALFNKALKTKYIKKDGSIKYPKGIVKYEDFFTIKPALNEWDVLETMKESALISGTIHDSLCHFLRDRNNFAHPNFMKPNEHKASAYIEDLLDIITNKMFRKK
jgi:hypothetical protein